MRDTMQLISKSESIVVLLQLTHLARTEYPGRVTPSTAWKHWHDPGFESIKPGEKDLARDVDAYMKLHCGLFDHQAYMIKLMCALVGLTSFLQRHNVPYLIFAGPMELNQFEPESFYDYLAHDTGVLNLRHFNMLHLTGAQDHPTAKGMRAIADYFIETLTPRKF